MKKETILHWARLLAMPILIILLGLVLLFSPDTASALVGKLLAWVCILAGAALGAGVFLNRSGGQNNRLVWAVISLAAGVWMLLNPLTIAKFLGRVLGLTLMIRGAQAITENLRYNGRKLVLSPALILAGVTVAAGALLVILPMATSRLVFNLVGLVMIGVGIAEGYDRLRGRKQLDEGQDPNIIDVEKV